MIQMINNTKENIRPCMIFTLETRKNKCHDPDEPDQFTPYHKVEQWNIDKPIFLEENPNILNIWLDVDDDGEKIVNIKQVGIFIRILQFITSKHGRMYDLNIPFLDLNNAQWYKDFFTEIINKYQQVQDEVGWINIRITCMEE